MQNNKYTSKSRKKKSSSDTRQSHPYYNMAMPSNNDNPTPNHNGHLRSTSTSKNRKARVMTDYDEHYGCQFVDGLVGRVPYLGNTNNQKSRNKRSFEGRMRDRKSIILGIGCENQRGKSFNIGHANGNESLVQSTKNNPNKNLELKYLFKSKKQSKPEPKPAIFQHPIMKYFTSKNKPTNNTLNQPILSQATPKEQIRRQSPYANARQISKFEQIYMINTRNHQVSLSKSKEKKRRISSHKRQASIGIQRNQINLAKGNIKIGLQNCNSRKNCRKQKAIPFGNTQNRRNQAHGGILERAPQEEEQSTVKTIKKTTKQDVKKPQQSYYSEYSQSPEQDSSNENDDCYGLTEQQEQTFGDRFPYGFEKIKLLGRGGFSLVWLGKHQKSGKLFAIKQIITQNTHQTHIKQIWFGTMFFMLGGVPKPQFSQFPGIKNLSRMYSYEINQTDTWIFYERCGCSLGSTLYDIRSEKVYGEERLYKIFYKETYLEMSNDPSILRSILKPICKTLSLLSETQIVHSDLKTENILIRYEQDPIKITEVKLIDYGSSFEFKNISQFSMATPQYMPPEILNYIIHENEGQYEQDLYQEVMNNYKNPWVVDIFSLGCVMLQIVIGVPLWMSLPLLVPMGRNSSLNGTGSYLQKQGLFAVKGRLFPEIIQKQRMVIGMLDAVLKNQNHSKIMLSEGLIRILKGMLEIDFNKRMSPMEVLEILEKEDQQQTLLQ